MSTLSMINTNRLWKDFKRDAGVAANAIGDGVGVDLNPVGKALKRAGGAIYDKVATQDLLSLHSPEEISKLKAEYMTQLGLKDATYSADAFDKLLQTRPTDFNLFKDTKGLNGLSVHAKLSVDSPATKAVSGTIAILLKPSPALVEAQKNYNQSVAAIKELAANRRPEQLIGLMMEVRNNAVKEIEKQHALEIQELDRLFAQTDAAATGASFTTQLRNALDLSSVDASGMAAVKENMLKDLKGNHAKQLEGFNKATNDAVNKLHEASAKQMKQFHFLATLYKNNDEMRKAIDEFLVNKRPNPGAVTVKVGGTKNRLDFLGMSINDLPFKVDFTTGKELLTITTLTGKKISIDKKDGSVSMEFGGVTDLSYRWSSEKKPLADFMFMAHTVRATGHKGISFDLQFKDPETANLRGREAYEAAIRCGFPPDQIEIKINGNVQKIEELFADHQQTLGRLKNVSEKIRQRFDEITQIKPDVGDSLKDTRVKMKEKMTELRNAGKAKEKDVAEAQAAAGAEHVSIVANN